MLAVLRLRDFRLLLVGGLVSNIGSWLIVIAVPYHAYQLTGSPTSTALTLAAESLPALVIGPAAGVFVDRWDHRRVLIVTDLVCAVALIGIPLADRPDRLWLLYAAVLVENTASTFFAPAARALRPAVVGTGPELSAANSLLAVCGGVVRLAGPPLGAVLLTGFGLSTVVVVDLATYLVSALAVACTRTRSGAVEPAAGLAKVPAELLAGLRFVAGHRVLRGVLLVNFGFWATDAVFSALLIPFMTGRFGGRPALLGVQLSALGAGYLIGGPLSGRLVERWSPRVTLVAGLLGVGGCFLVLANAPNAVVAVVATGLAGVPGALVYVTVETTVQRRTPKPLLGRAGATFFASDAAAGLVGALVAALVGSGMGAGTGAGIGGHVELSFVLTVSAVTMLMIAVLTPIAVAGSTDGHSGWSVRVIFRRSPSGRSGKFAGQRPISDSQSKSPERPGI